MLDDFPLLREEPSRAELLVILAIAAGLAGWSVGLAWNAWVGTPDVANFRHFAEPPSSRFESKGSCLFSPVAIQLYGFFVLLLATCMPKRVRDRLLPPLRRIGVCWMLCFSLLCLWGTSVQSSHAPEAARRLEPPPGNIAAPGQKALP